MAKVAEIKTKPTTQSVQEFLNTIDSEQKRTDSFVLLELMEKHTHQKPKLWGSSIVGFGDVRVKSPTTGREVDWFAIGFSPRKANISIYLMDLTPHTVALQQLGRHKTGVGCLYINKFTNIDITVLEQIIQSAAKERVK